MNMGLSKTEIIAKIKVKTRLATPIIRADLLNSLNRKSIPTLERILKSVRVDKENGYLAYLPQSIPAVRDVNSIVYEAFYSHSPEKISGRLCVHKDYIQRGVRSRVLKILDAECIVCGRTENIQVHHIKPERRTWNNAFGLTVLCETCHKKIRSGIGKTKSEVIEICYEITSPGGKIYDPPDPIIYPEPTIVKLAHYLFFYYE